MIKNFFILIAIGMVPAIITNDKMIINIDKTKYPKTFELLKNTAFKIKYYWATPEELMAMEYLINKLKIPSIKKEEIFNASLTDPDVDMEIIIPIIIFYLEKHINKFSFIKNYKPTTLEKIHQLKKFVKDLNVTDEIKEKLLDAYNNNENFLKSVLDENNLKKYNELWEEAAQERYYLIVNNEGTHEEINEFIVNIENLLSIKLSQSPSSKQIIKLYLNILKNCIVESHYFNIILRAGSRVDNMSQDIFQRLKISLIMIIMDTIVKNKFNKVNYPLINQVIYFSVFDIKKSDDPKKISRKDYEEKLKKNNIDFEYITYFFWYINWKKFVEIKNLDDIVNIIIDYKKKFNINDIKKFL
jgi:hypothetical protein